MRAWHLALVVVLAVGILAGCGGEAAAPAGQDETAQGPEAAQAYTSTALDVSYEGALPVDSQLALGTMQLEETENAVTAEQAKTLLPLWQIIQGGSLQNNAETQAVLKQIEKAMTPEQLAAIAAMQLTEQDLMAWMQEQGVEMSQPPEGAGAQGGFADMSDEERAALRATMEAGGGAPPSGAAGGPGGGGTPPAGAPGGASEEERATMRATAEAGGMTMPGRGAGAAAGQLSAVAQRLVELLSRRAAE